MLREQLKSVEDEHVDKASLPAWKHPGNLRTKVSTPGVKIPVSSRLAQGVKNIECRTAFIECQVEVNNENAETTNPAAAVSQFHKNMPFKAFDAEVWLIVAHQQLVLVVQQDNAVVHT